MARTHFSFTFTNAQPGASVHFSSPVFADATTRTPDGPTLVLDSSNAVSVWSDAGYLTAITVDGNGQPLSATALAESPTVTADSGTAGVSPFASSVDSWLFAKLGGVNQPNMGWFIATWAGTVEGAGSDITLNADGQTFDIATTGLYVVSVETYVTCDAAVGASRWVGPGFNNIFNAPSPGYLADSGESHELPIPDDLTHSSARWHGMTSWPPAKMLAGMSFQIAWDANPVDGSIAMERYSSVYIARLS